MAVKSSDAITVVFTTRRFDTGAATNGDSLPTGTLYIDGTADAATVTVTNITTGVYKAAVTLPSLTIGNRCELRISATVNSVTDNAVIWRDACDIATDSSGHVTVGNYASGKTPLQPTVAGRTLDVTATGCAGIDWSNVENPTTTLVLSGTTIGTCTTNTDMRGTDGAALASNWTSTRAGYLDSVLIAANSNRTVLVTGSNHVAAAVHDAEPDSIPEDAFITGAFSARVLAADAGAEIATAVRTELATELGRIDATVGSRSTLTATQAADAVLTRGAANVETTAEAYSITDMLLGVFESKVETGTWTIYRSDGTTVHRTKTITTDGTANPITRVQ